MHRFSIVSARRASAILASVVVMFCVSSTWSAAQSVASQETCPPNGLAIATTPTPPQNTAGYSALKAAQDAAPDQSVVLIGDSQILHWPDQEYRRLASDGRVISLGVTADTVQTVLWRVQHESIAHLNPKRVILMAGGNNLGREPGCAIGSGILAIQDALEDIWPEARLTYISIPPRGSLFGANDEQRLIANEIVRVANQDHPTAEFINIDEYITCGMYRKPTVAQAILAQENVSSCKFYRSDSRHLSWVGYRALTDVIVQFWQLP